MLKRYVGGRRKYFAHKMTLRHLLRRDDACQCIVLLWALLGNDVWGMLGCRVCQKFKHVTDIRTLSTPLQKVHPTPGSHREAWANPFPKV